MESTRDPLMRTIYSIQSTIVNLPSRPKLNLCLKLYKRVEGGNLERLIHDQKYVDAGFRPIITL